MRTRDTFDVMSSTAAALADAVAVFVGFLLAVWIRFDAGWIPLRHEAAPPRMMYFYGAAIGALLFLFIFRSLGLYIRPQTGSFSDKIPRLIRATGWGILLAVVLAYGVQINPPFSRITVGLSFFTIAALVLLERWILFRLEWNLARHREEVNRVVVLGTDAIAVHIKRALKNEPTLRSRIVAFLRCGAAAPQAEIPADLIRGGVDDLSGFIERGEVDQVIVADITLPNQRLAEIMLLCERNLVSFQIVPDLFGLLTQKVRMTMVGDVPLLGISKWPLDYCRRGGGAD
ncbi:MAG: hypothetical protein NTV49_06050 [Kiritimatiellaeota bacterium]|nr:hypothetical protein [Kiritimatiellota bacterium]